jgi:hypothetical protein
MAKRPQSLLAALSSDVARVKYPAIKALRGMSERSPGRLYPHFDFFAGLLGGENNILRWNAMLILGNLASVDADRKLNAILDDYLTPITGPQLIDANNTVSGATAIALARPDLTERIVACVLKVERGHYATPECRNVAIGHALECLARLLPAIADTRPIQRFAQRQVKNSRPATAKNAQRLLSIQSRAQRSGA